MKESWLYDKLSGGRVRCRVCAVRCAIPPGHRGACGARINEGGVLQTLLDGLASTVCVDPIEKKPLYHFHPGTRVLSLGAVGCCFRCPGCQNWQISHAQADRFGRGMQRIDPRESADIAWSYGCAGIAWTYNDPAIWIEQTVPGAARAKQLGLYSVYVTNGYVTPEHLAMVGPFLTAWRVDLKGFSRATCKKMTGVAKWEPALEMTRMARFTYGMHVECVTNVTPSINDDESELRDIARWIRTGLGPFTPWHVTRFFPYLRFSHLPPTSIRTLERAREIGLEEGLRYVYIGNVPGHLAADTRCHECGTLLVERDNGVFRDHIVDGLCPHCDVEIPGRWKSPIPVPK